MGIKKLKSLAASLVLLILSFPGFAHHSRAIYDMTQDVVYEGIVSELHWRNPHIFMMLQTTDDNGELYELEVEVASVSEASALGLTREVVSEGQRLTVLAHPGKRAGAQVAVGLHVTASDGRMYPLNTDAKFTLEKTTIPATGLAGKWAPTLESFNNMIPIIFGPQELTMAGELAREGAAANVRAAGGAILGICEPFPPPILSIFPDLRMIEIQDNEILMSFEGGVGLSMERTVYLGGDEHPKDLKPTLMGHSIGRWEGETLVIDTIGFVPNPNGGFAFTSSSEKHLMERLTLAENHLSLTYEFIMEDPVNLVNPVSLSATWLHRPDLEPTEVVCDPDTARRSLQD